MSLGNSEFKLSHHIISILSGTFVRIDPLTAEGRLVSTLIVNLDVALSFEGFLWIELVEYFRLTSWRKAIWLNALWIIRKFKMRRPNFSIILEACVAHHAILLLRFVKIAGRFIIHVRFFFNDCRSVSFLSEFSGKSCSVSVWSVDSKLKYN